MLCTIRTTRISVGRTVGGRFFTMASVDDPEMLLRYQQAVLASHEIVVGAAASDEFYASNFWLSRRVRLRYSGSCFPPGDSLRKGHDHDNSLGWC